MDGIVVIAASAGGLGPLRSIIAALPAPCTAAVFVVMHSGPYPSILPDLLGRAGVLPAAFARDGDKIGPGRRDQATPRRPRSLGAIPAWRGRRAAMAAVLRCAGGALRTASARTSRLRRFRRSAVDPLDARPCHVLSRPRRGGGPRPDPSHRQLARRLARRRDPDPRPLALPQPRSA